ncbi:sigma-54-dependent Fis family transcriptional regulator [Rossellomorea sp. KS-H15a]|uniref:sigma-54 interaction domain-containing protein n=1 Tax=Rossellomorea sp. KS-H15a TaxID=2963940 RepID=UPI0020C69EA7|nr:sigma 54-interacting transcriptional regulator [Rossellomorea sp. KS-H15a]UTE77243.1 sigma 54-interacting transcriptional regulator [Rossellomorea sp. KS-H15a]
MNTELSELEQVTQEVKELRTLNRELEAIIESSYDVIYITDKNGVTLKTNSAIERITGIPKEYYIGKSVDALMKRGILKSSVTQKVIEQKRSVSTVQYNYSGKETLITGNPVINDDGEIEKVVTNIRDLSELNELQTALKKANELNNSYKKEIERLKGVTKRDGDVVIASHQMKLIYEMAERIADVDATVLILGETGVGKDVLAKFIYSQSIRAKQGEFIKLNCGAIPPDLLESELFGYEAGAFTGANSNGKPGMLELADNGILFLDEVGELSLALQVKLLRTLQEKEIRRVGATKSKKVNVRIIAATNRNLKEMVHNGEFREDLYYRLNVIPIAIPPLKGRRDDILPLIQLFLQQTNHKYGKDRTIDVKLNDFFYRYNWPGNVRELSNLIERMVLTTQGKELTIRDLPIEYKESNNSSLVFTELMTLKEAVEIAEEKVLSLAVNTCHTTYEIAEALGTSQPTIVRKLKKYRLKIKE